MADVLSQKYEDEGSFFFLSFIVPDWLQAMRQEWLQDPKSSHLIQQLQNKAQAPPGYSWLQDELQYKGRLYLSKKSKLKSTVLSKIHATPTAGHSGFTKTYDRVKRSFFWDGMKQDICKFVAKCEVCQHNKGETIKSPGTVQPLPIPPAIWKDISMDFITGLPKLGNKSVIMVVVDRFFKYAHFCALQHPFTASTVAQILMDQVFKLHGMPNSIVSDRDPTFTSNFWQELFKLQGTQLHLSSAYYPQADGQMEVVNKCLETYMRCFAYEKQHQWAQWLPLAEWWYNTTYHTATRMTHFEAVYG
jgi:transposase InsO family protein